MISISLHHLYIRISVAIFRNRFRGSRRARSSSSLTLKKSDKWYNLIMGDRPWALDKLHSWHRNILVDSMIIDIILVHPHHHLETVMERWVVHYENPLIFSPQLVTTRFTRKQSFCCVPFMRRLGSYLRIVSLGSWVRLDLQGFIFPWWCTLWRCERVSFVPPGRLCASVTWLVWV